MMFLYRVLYSKSGMIRFLPHVEMPRLFSRSMRRAGIMPAYTEGFSPHPKISLGPALASGVEGWFEPADLFLEGHIECDELMTRLNNSLPDGLSVRIVEEWSGASLNKGLDSSFYEMEFESASSFDAMEVVLSGTCVSKKNRAGEQKELNILSQVLVCGVVNERLELVVSHEKNIGVNIFVDLLKQAEIISGWADLRIIRKAVGIWDLGSVIPPAPFDRKIVPSVTAVHGGAGNAK